MKQFALFLFEILSIKGDVFVFSS